MNDTISDLSFNGNSLSDIITTKILIERTKLYNRPLVQLLQIYFNKISLILYRDIISLIHQVYITGVSNRTKFYSVGNWQSKRILVDLHKMMLFSGVNIVKFYKDKSIKVSQKCLEAIEDFKKLSPEEEVTVLISKEKVEESIIKLVPKLDMNKEKIDEIDEKGKKYKSACLDFISMADKVAKKLPKEFHLQNVTKYKKTYIDALTFCGLEMKESVTEQKLIHETHGLSKTIKKIAEKQIFDSLFTNQNYFDRVNEVVEKIPYGKKKLNENFAKSVEILEKGTKDENRILTRKFIGKKLDYLGNGERNFLVFDKNKTYNVNINSMINRKKQMVESIENKNNYNKYSCLAYIDENALKPQPKPKYQLDSEDISNILNLIIKYNNSNLIKMSVRDFRKFIYNLIKGKKQVTYENKLDKANNSEIKYIYQFINKRLAEEKARIDTKELEQDVKLELNKLTDENIESLIKKARRKIKEERMKDFMSIVVKGVKRKKAEAVDDKCMPHKIKKESTNFWEKEVNLNKLSRMLEADNLRKAEAEKKGKELELKEKELKEMESKQKERKEKSEGYITRLKELVKTQELMDLINEIQTPEGVNKYMSMKRAVCSKTIRLIAERNTPKQEEMREIVFIIKKTIGML